LGPTPAEVITFHLSAGEIIPTYALQVNSLLAAVIGHHPEA
jgi:hypothetical protein